MSFVSTIPSPMLSLEGGRAALRFANSYSRLPTLIELSSRMEDADWLKLLGQEWTTCDNIVQHSSALVHETQFADAIEDPLVRPYLMDAEEREVFADLPEVVTLWRGCYAHNREGLCWSLDRATASGFPFLHRYKHTGQRALLVRARCERSEIIAIKLGRNEAEAIAFLPNVVEDIDLGPVD